MRPRRDEVPTYRQRIWESGWRARCREPSVRRSALPTGNAPRVECIDIGLRTRDKIMIEADVVVLDDTDACKVDAERVPTDKNCAAVEDSAGKGLHRPSSCFAAALKQTTVGRNRVERPTVDGRAPD